MYSVQNDESLPGPRDISSKRALPSSQSFGLHFMRLLGKTAGLAHKAGIRVADGIIAASHRASEYRGAHSNEDKTKCLEQELADVRCKLEEAEKQVSTIQNNEAEATQKLREKEEILAAIRLELEEARNQAQETESRLSSELDALRSEKDSLSSELQAARGQLEEANARIGALEAELGSARGELEQTRNPV